MPDFEIRNVNISDDAAAAPGRPMWGYIQLTHYTEDAFSTALKNIINAFKKRMFFLSYLRVFLYWPLQDGWGGGAGAGMQSDAQGDRNMKRSFHWFPIKKKTTDGCKHILVSFQSSPVFTGIRLLYLMLLVMLTALHPRFFYLPKRRLTESGPSPLLASKPRTDSRRAVLSWQMQAPPPPPQLSQSHCRVIYEQGSPPHTQHARRRLGSKPASSSLTSVGFFIQDWTEIKTSWMFL